MNWEKDERGSEGKEQGRDGGAGGKLNQRGCRAEGFEAVLFIKNTFYWVEYNSVFKFVRSKILFS